MRTLLSVHTKYVDLYTLYVLSELVPSVYALVDERIGKTLNINLLPWRIYSMLAHDNNNALNTITWQRTRNIDRARN